MKQLLEKITSLTKKGKIEWTKGETWNGKEKVFTAALSRYTFNLFENRLEVLGLVPRDETIFGVSDLWNLVSMPTDYADLLNKLEGLEDWSQDGEVYRRPTEFKVVIKEALDTKELA